MVCQARGGGQRLTCPERDSHGYRCEKRGPHTDHWISEHTIQHALAGNGYSCAAITDMLMERLWK